MWGKKKRGGGSNHRRLWARGNRNRGNGNEDERTKRRYVLMTPHQYHALKGKSTYLTIKRVEKWVLFFREKNFFLKCNVGFFDLCICS